MTNKRVSRWIAIGVLLSILACILIFKKSIMGAIHESTETLLTFFSHHMMLGLLFAFTVAFLEALPIIGTIIPGSITMTIVGILIGTHTLPLLTGILSCTLGAYFGDCIGYTVGRHFQSRITNTWPFSRYIKMLSYAKKFVEKHGGKSVFIGRFVGPIRSCVPLVTGMLGLRLSVFLIVAFFSSLCWSFAYAGPGIILGKLAIELPPSAIIKLLTVFSFWIICFYFAIWILFKFYQIGILFLKQMSDKISASSQQSWLKQFLTYSNNNNQSLLKLLLAMSLLFTIFICLSINVYFKLSLTAWNQPLFHFLQSLHTTTLSTMAIFMTNLGYIKLVLITAVLLTIALALQPNRTSSACFLLSLIFTIGSVWILKKIIHSPRPDGFNLVKSTSSFPSGHTSFSIILFGAIAFYTAKIKPQWKKISYSLAVFIITLVAASRLYLGAHWLTDIIGSILVGSIFLCLNAFLFYKYNGNLTLPLKKWATLCLVAVMTPWLIYSINQREKEFYNYTPTVKSITISSKQWWLNPSSNTNKNRISVYRNDRFGIPRQPLNIQWQGSFDQIRASLIKLGFTAHETHASLKRDIENMSNITASQQPLLPWLYKNSHPVLLMTHPFKNKNIILELRIWRSQIQNKDSSRPPIWIGAINFHIRQAFFSWETHYQSITYRHNNTDTSQWLQLQLQKHWKTQTITLHNVIHSKEFNAMNWKGRIILITNCHSFSQ